ncbi:uncharacterized protein LOC127794695 isoform X2 [Diospyros lotus]|uniref:uncharacterized protein LOC127794695 isoform X2 n=1 Tax=Diospyros lotus TaxID=55363 RepID=UPI00224F673C|nr:uncharacterized protein LOC127794695 isoform X2 [Diospyros lotus]
MLCSISAGKSGSKWLDRLRSSKGFPSGDGLDLEQFLIHHNSHLSNTSDDDLSISDPNSGPKLGEQLVPDDKRKAETPRENGESEWFGVMSNVLAELFNMGDGSNLQRINAKKSSRKQANPKICLHPTSSSENGDGILPRNDENSLLEKKGASDPIRLPKEQNVGIGIDVDLSSADGEEDENCRADLAGFSRTEVTVIDTSYSSWKCEKLLFRRKNVWRVRENKTKSTNTGMKKRKLNPLEDESAGRVKKLKQCSSSKDANGEDRVMTSNNIDLQSDKMKKNHKETPDILGQVPKKRCPRKSKKPGSSVILIKSIPASKKDGSKSHKK